MKLLRTHSDARDRIGDFVIAVSLAVFPLLPAGPTYFGFRWPWALEIFFLSAVAIGLLLVAPASADVSSATSDEAVRLVRIGYLTWLIPVVAGTLIGLMERNPFEWAVLRAEADGLLSRLIRPMHQVADPYYPLQVGLTYIEGGLAFWLLSAALKRTGQPNRRINTATYGCLVGIGLVSTIAIVQYFTRANLLDYWVRANPGLTRSHSTLDDPNALASFLVLAIGLVGGVAWSTSRARSDWRRSAGPLVILGLAGAALVATVSRAGLLSLIVAALFFAFRRLVQLASRQASSSGVRLAARSAIALILGAVTLWVALALVTPGQDESDLPNTPVEAFRQTFDWHRPFAGILKGRVKIWSAAYYYGSTELSLGIGVGQFPRLYSSFPGSDGPENTHNFFLQVFAESGLLGLAGLSVLLATVAAAFSFARRERSPAQGALATWLSIGLLAFVLTWVTGHPLLNLSNQLWFACVMAVGLAALKVR